VLAQPRPTGLAGFGADPQPLLERVIASSSAVGPQVSRPTGRPTLSS